MIKIEEGKNYLVTGGSGFLGQELISRILSMHGRVTIVARNEGELIKTKQKFPDIEYYTGDISDKFALKRFKDIQGIFHLAAFKHVGLAESQARECALSNVLGSLNVLEHAVDIGVEFVVEESMEPLNSLWRGPSLNLRRTIQKYNSERLGMETFYTQLDLFFVNGKNCSNKGNRLRFQNQRLQDSSGR